MSVRPRPHTIVAEILGVIPTARLSQLFLFLEIVLADAAEWAFPVIGEFLERCTRRNVVLRVADFGIINVTTNFTNVLFHFIHLFVIINRT